MLVVKSWNIGQKGASFAMRTKEAKETLAALAAANPDYPPDYYHFLDDCFDHETGNVRIDYTEWKRRKQT